VSVPAEFAEFRVTVFPESGLRILSVTLTTSTQGAEQSAGTRWFDAIMYEAVAENAPPLTVIPCEVSGRVPEVTLMTGAPGFVSL